MQANPSVKLSVLIQSLGIRRQGLIPLLEGGGDDLRQPDERAAPGLDLAVERGSHEEGDDGERHGDGGDAEAPAPADVVLHVDNGGEGGERGEPHAEVVEVEEVPAAAGHARARHVELVGREGDDAGAEAARADGGEEEGDVEHPQLRSGGLHAVGLGRAGRWAQ